MKLPTYTYIYLSKGLAIMIPYMFLVRGDYRCVGAIQTWEVAEKLNTL